jgi:anthranilate synthase component 2/para-aminobenzoate synthetase component 2|tara:strand:- start:356 stop:913 length:558 start_codon:yes stop_codon:yes gene_type:complete
MIYLIDHEDSFTFNLAHLLGKFDDVVVSNYYDIDKSKIAKAKTIVLSPGPGEPKDYPITSKIYHQFRGKKKFLGICLGFQQILYAEGGKIIQQNKIFHGYQSVISVLPSSKVFKNIKNLSVGRYHSLKLQEPFHSNTLKITMRCKISKVAMALEDHTNNVFGFQFHPDSYLTKNGKLLIQKILSA